MVKIVLDPCKGCLVEPMCSQSKNCGMIGKKIEQLNYVKETASIFIFVGFALVFGLYSYNEGLLDNNYVISSVLVFIILNLLIYIYFMSIVDSLKLRIKGYKI